MAKSIKRNAFASTMLKVLNIIFPIIVGPYLARTLSEIEYGEFNRAASIVAWFIPFASFGIYNYGVRQISKIRDDKEQLSKVFTCLFVMGCISCTIVSIIYIIYSFIAIDAGYQLLYFASGIQIFSLFCYVEWMNEAFENYGFILVKTLILRILNIILIFLFVRKPSDIVQYALIISIITFLNYGVSFIYMKKQVPFVKVQFDDLKKYVLPLCSMLLLSNANLLYTALDRLFLSMQPNGTLVTYYTFSMTLIMLITQVINSIVIVTIPRLSHYLGQKEWDKYLDLLHVSSRSFFLLGIPMCIGFSCFANTAMFIYGDITYIAAGTTLSVFGIRTLFWLADQSMAYQVIFANGYEKKLTKFYFICGSINFLLDFLLLHNQIYNPAFYVLTTMFSELILVSLEYFTIKNDISEQAEVINKHFFKYLGVSLLFIPISVIGKRIFNYEYIMNINFLLQSCTLILLCVIVYFAVLYIIKDDLVYLNINKIKNKLFPHRGMNK